MKEFLLKYAPNFCFVDAEGLYQMALIHYGKKSLINEVSFKNCLYKLTKLGYFVTVPDPQGHCASKLYLRVRS